MSENELSKQVADQCRVVAHLAEAISKVHDQKAKLFDAKTMPDIAAYAGWQTAALMEQLGEILNGMDAVSAEEDAWTDPIFERAQKLFPIKGGH